MGRFLRLVISAAELPAPTPSHWDGAFLLLNDNSPPLAVNCRSENMIYCPPACGRGMSEAGGGECLTGLPSEDSNNPTLESLHLGGGFRFLLNRDCPT